MKRYLLGFAAFSLVGCGAPMMLDPMEQTQDPNKVAHPTVLDYPTGPYGFTLDSVVAPDLVLTGMTDSNTSGLLDTADTVKTFKVSDYYKSKYKVLFIGVAAEWCVPCQNEQPALVSLYGKNKDNVAFLEAMIQDVKGKPADMTVVTRWSKRFNIGFDMAADPTVALGPYYQQAAFPMQLIIDLSTMKITFQGNGSGGNTEAELQSQFDYVLNSGN
jgi:thiol-disulfide isomerase/thioredoxin